MRAEPGVAPSTTTTPKPASRRPASRASITPVWYAKRTILPSCETSFVTVSMTPSTFSRPVSRRSCAICGANFCRQNGQFARQNAVEEKRLQPQGRKIRQNVGLLSPEDEGLQPLPQLAHVLATLDLDAEAVFA